MLQITAFVFTLNPMFAHEGMTKWTVAVIAKLTVRTIFIWMKESAVLISTGISKFAATDVFVPVEKTASKPFAFGSPRTHLRACRRVQSFAFYVNTFLAEETQ